MINNRPFTIAVILVFLFLQIAEAQHFERNWQSRDRIGVSRIEASQADDGWLTVVGGFGNYEVEKYDAQGNLVWNFAPADLGFWKNNSYTFTPLQNGNYLFTVQGTDCDFCTQTGLVELDELGQVVGKDTIALPDPSFACEGFWSVLQLSDSTLWIFGFDHLWEYNLNTFSGNPISYEELGFLQGPTATWLGKDGLVYLAFEQVLILDQNKVRVDSFPLSRSLDFGMAMTDSTHLIVGHPFLNIINNQGNTLKEWENPMGEFLADVEIVGDKIITVGAGFSDFTAILNRFDLDLSNHERFEWGTDFLQTYGLAVQDSIVLIGGEEFSFVGFNRYFTPYLKTLNLDDFSTADYQKEAALESISIDSLIGEVTGEFIDPDSTVWVSTASWKFHYVNIVIKNNGAETLKEVTVNWLGSGAPCTDILHSRKIEINLLPGLDTLISLGNLTNSEIATALPENLELCIWLTAPDELLDADNTNDFICETFPLKDISSTNDIFTADDIDIYPNPASDFLNIDFKNAELTDSKVQIIDLLGKVVLVDENEKGVYSKKLNVSHLSKGVYFLILKNEKGSVVKRWVKG